VKRQKVCVTLTADELWLLRRTMLCLRHRAMDAALPTEDIDALLIRIMK